MFTGGTDIVTVRVNMLTVITGVNLLSVQP